jgi:hypothetical protein
MKNSTARPKGAEQMKTFIVLIVLTQLTACVSTSPTPIGGDTYYSQKSTAGGEFGNTSAAAEHLMVSANKFCAAKGLEFQLMTQTRSRMALT